MNKVILSGRITKDPEIRYTQSGMSSIRFNIAVDKIQKDAQGNKQADFISCVAFGTSADFIGKYCTKGNMLLIEGRIQTGQFQGQDGQMRYTTDVVVERVENMTPRSQQPRENNGQYQAPAQQQYQAPNGDIDTSDLPF